MALNKLTADALVDGTLDADAIGPASVTHQKLHSNIISGQSVIGSVDASNDLLLIYDNDTTSLKKVAVSSVGATNTDGLTEGSSNLYYTNARADARAQLKIDALVDSAPGALDTLNELAAALGDDANFSTTVTNSIATKLPLAGGTMTGSLDLNGTELVLDVDGDSSITADTDDQIDVKLGGSDRISIKASGSTSVDLNAGGSMKLTVGGSDSHQFINGSDTVLTIDSSGNVDLAGYINFSGTASSFTNISQPRIFRSGSSSGSYPFDAFGHLVLQSRGDGSNRDIVFATGTSGANKSVIDASGNVGIGTTSPQIALDVIGDLAITSGTNAKVTINDNIGEVGAGNIAFQASNSSGSALKPMGFRGEDIRFATGSDERMRIDSSGRVMIGTTTEGVAGADELTVGTTTAGNGITIRSASNSSGALFFSDGTSGGAEYDGGFEYNHSNQYMRFISGESERLRLLGTGAVLQFGGTTNAGFVDFNGSTLQINTQRNPETGAFINTGRAHSFIDLFDGNGTPANSYVRIGTAASNNTTGTERLRINSAGLDVSGSVTADSQVKVLGSNASLVAFSVGDAGTGWYNAGSNAIALSSNGTPSIWVTSGGNVGIGETNPDGLLHVRGGTGKIMIQTDGAFAGTGEAMLDFRHYDDTGDPSGRISLKGTTNYTGDMVFQVRGGGTSGAGGAGLQEHMRIKSDNAGVEITRTSTDQTIGLALTNQQSGGYGSSIVFNSKRTDNNAIVEAAKIRVQGENSWNGASNVGSQITFSSQKDGTLTQHMVISKNGNVGIGNTSPSARIHVSPDGTYTHSSPFSLTGGKIYSNDIYTDYVYKWSGYGTRTVDLLCNSYHMMEVTYTSHQTNGGSDIHRLIKGKWANNHTTHTWTTYHDSGNTWGISLTITATDQSGSSGGSANGRLRIRQTYGSGSYHSSTLTLRAYYDSFTGINISTS